LFFHADLAGSVRAVTDAGGAVVAASDYSAFGEPLPVAGLDPVSSVAPFGFAGEWADPSGLVYLRARFYDPSSGVFLSADPAVAVSGDSYGYAAGNPLQVGDPLGLWPWDGWSVDWLSAGKGVTNFLYGAVDSLLMGGPSLLLGALGWESEWLDSCSDAFFWGGVVEQAAEIVVSVVASGGLALPAALAKAAARKVVGAGARAGARFAGRGAARVGARSAGRGAARGAGRSCLTSFGLGTPVLLADGSLVPVGEVAAGDAVATMDPETGAVGGGSVGAVFPHRDAVVVLAAGGEELETTASHSWWVASDGRWEATASLDAGDLLLTAAGALVEVGSVAAPGAVSPVVDLTVDPVHTLLVGEQSILAHNSSTACPTGSGPGGGGSTPEADFIVDSRGVAIPTSRRRLEDGFTAAGIKGAPTKSPGVQYTYPHDGTTVRIMEPSGKNGLRASFQNSGNQRVDPWTDRPVHPPRGLSGSQRKGYIGPRTHVELKP
jgi:RHS repeat-associated protein